MILEQQLPEAETLNATEWQPALFVLPTRNGAGFQASVRGHLLELADPDAPAGLAPTPDDLLLVSVASDVAWSARRLLRARGLDPQVSVSARHRSRDVDVTVTVSEQGATIEAPLTAELESALAMRFRSARVRVR